MSTVERTKIAKINYYQVGLGNHEWFYRMKSQGITLWQIAKQTDRQSECEG